MSSKLSSSSSSSKNGKTKKRNILKTSAKIAARKATLLSKLLTRHKRLDHPASTSNASNENAPEQDAYVWKSAPPPQSPRQGSKVPSKPSPFQNMVDKSLRKKQQRVAIARTQSLDDSTPEQETKKVAPPPPPPPPPPKRPAMIDTQVEIIPSPISPLTPVTLPSTISGEPPVREQSYRLDELDLSRGDEEQPYQRITPCATINNPPIRERSFRFADVVTKEDKEQQYQQVLQSSLSTNLMADFNAESPALKDDAGPERSTFAMVGVAGVSLICITCTTVLGFAWLPTISCLVTIALSVYVMNLYDDSRNRRKRLQSRQSKLSRTKQRLQMSNSNYRSRIMAARMSKARYEKVERSLEQSSSTHRLNVATKQAANIEEIQRRLRNQVLLIVSKAVVVSNKQRSKQMVLNPLGLDIIVGRLSKMDKIDVDREDFEQILEQHGSSQGALAVLYKLIMDKNSALIKYDLGVSSWHAGSHEDGASQKLGASRKLWGSFRK